MDAREARNDFQAGRLSAEQLIDLLERQERLVQHLHAEVQRLKQRLAQYEPEILREPPPSQSDPRPLPPPTVSTQKNNAADRASVASYRRDAGPPN